MNKTIFVTGLSGFVDKNIKSSFSDYVFIEFNKSVEIKINEVIVFHFAGKAHDVKMVSTADEYYKVNTDLTKDIFDAFLT